MGTRQHYVKYAGFQNTSCGLNLTSRRIISCDCSKFGGNINEVISFHLLEQSGLHVNDKLNGWCLNKNKDSFLKLLKKSLNNTDGSVKELMSRHRKSILVFS